MIYAYSSSKIVEAYIGGMAPEATYEFMVAMSPASDINATTYIIRSINEKINAKSDIVPALWNPWLYCVVPGYGC